MQTVKIAPFLLIGIAVRTTNENNKANDDIAQLWQRFLGESILEKIPHKVDHTVYSLYTEYEGDHTKPYTAIIGCKVSSLANIPEHMLGKSFGGGLYHKSTTRGDISKGLIVKHWTQIWNMDLDRAYTADFELFGEKAQDPANAEVEFYISLNE